MASGSMALQYICSSCFGNLMLSLLGSNGISMYIPNVLVRSTCPIGWIYIFDFFNSTPKHFFFPIPEILWRWNIHKNLAKRSLSDLTKCHWHVLCATPSHPSPKPSGASPCPWRFAPLQYAPGEPLNRWIRQIAWWTVRFYGGYKML